MDNLHYNNVTYPHPHLQRHHVQRHHETFQPPSQTDHCGCIKCSPVADCLSGSLSASGQSTLRNFLEKNYGNYRNCDRPTSLHDSRRTQMCILIFAFRSSYCLGSFTLQDLFQVSKYFLSRDRIRNFP